MNLWTTPAAPCIDTRITRVYGFPMTANNTDTHTPVRTVRVDRDLWATAKAIAGSRGETISAVINDALRRYVKRHQ